MDDIRIAEILTRLRNIAIMYDGSIEDSIDAYTADIERGLKEGWTPNELVNQLQWTEGVNPTVDEDSALRYMANIRAKVLARLNSEQK